MRTVLACHPDYGEYCGEGMARLAEAGCTVRLNPHGRLFTPEELHAAAADAEAVIADTEPWDEAAFAAAPRLKFLVRFGTGMNSVDLEAAKRRGVVVANTPGHNANAVAEQTVALLFALTHMVPELNLDCRAGKWTRALFHEFTGRTIGVLGFGAIGRRTAAKLSRLDARLLVYDKYPDPKAAEAIGATFATLDEVLAESHYLLLHLPLLPETERIVGAATIGRMRDGVYIVNTGRGPLVDEAAVAAALRAGKIAGFAADVFEDEPPRPDNPLFACSNYVCSPHISGSTHENMRNTGLAAAEAVLDVFAGREPRNRHA